MVSASGLTSMIVPRFGPFRSTASMRARYCSARLRAVQRPERIPSWSCATVTSSSSDGACAAIRAAPAARDGLRGRGPPQVRRGERAAQHAGPEERPARHPVS